MWKQSDLLFMVFNFLLDEFQFGRFNSQVSKKLNPKFQAGSLQPRVGGLGFGCEFRIKF